MNYQFVADRPSPPSGVIAAVHLPMTRAWLVEGLPTEKAAWTILPSWFTFDGLDRNVPGERHPFVAERADPRDTTEADGATHTLRVSKPGAATVANLEPVDYWDDYA